MNSQIIITEIDATRFQDKVNTATALGWSIKDETLETTKAPFNSPSFVVVLEHTNGAPIPPIPEPSMTAILCVGLVALAVIRKRRR